MTNDEMVEVMQWAYDNGKLTVSSSSVKNAQGNQQELLDLDNSIGRITWNGSTFGIKPERGSGYPCLYVSWYGAVAYCNYRSEMEGRTPCYNLSEWRCNWSNNGYRLPSEAEWEKAARGGQNGKRFSWGNTINHDYANYKANGSAFSYDASPYTSPTYHPLYDDGYYPYTSPVRAFDANAYGVHNMVGNVWEWCWDWKNDGYYARSPYMNPTGASSGWGRSKRGGGWTSDALHCRPADRDSNDPAQTSGAFGFRTVHNAN